MALGRNEPGARKRQGSLRAGRREKQLVQGIRDICRRSEAGIALAEITRKYPLTYQALREKPSGEADTGAIKSTEELRSASVASAS